MESDWVGDELGLGLCIARRYGVFWESEEGLAYTHGRDHTHMLRAESVALGDEDMARTWESGRRHALLSQTTLLG